MAQVPVSPGDLAGHSLHRSRASSGIDAFGRWLADTLNHAFGNPREEAAHQPPLVGVQPYCDRPRRRRRF
ncbi:MAG: hypothetical protein ACKO0M_16510 [Cyanobium sp.]